MGIFDLKYVKTIRGHWVFAFSNVVRSLETVLRRAKLMKKCGKSSSQDPPQRYSYRLEMANHSVKQSETWESGAVEENIWNTFDLTVLKVTSGSFGAFITKWPLTQTRLVVERNG